jgi:hypothetical protein
LNPQTSNRDIIIETKDSHPKRINQNHPDYDPLHYVLPFINGEKGYEFGIKQKDGTKNVTCQQYYSYYLHIRDLEKITVGNYGRLFQEYSTNMYSKIEMQRLQYFKSDSGQKRIRSELYQGLTDILDGKHGKNLKSVGKRIVLPSSFIGGPRHMNQLYQDAMGLIRKFGKPDLFITFTCNPFWPEICKLKFQLGNFLNHYI